MASDKKTTTVEETKVELKGAEAPKVINIEIPDEPKPRPEPKADGDLGAVRQGMSEAVPFIGRLLGKKEAPAAKPKKEESAEGGDAAAAKKVEDGKVADDRTAEAVLKVKPKKREEGKKEEPAPEEKLEPKQGMSVEQVAEVASAAAVKAIRSSQPAPEKKDAAKKSSTKEYPEEYRQNAQVFDYLSVAKPDQYGDIKERLVAFDQKHREYVSKWEEENPGEKFDADDEDHAEFYNKNFPDIDLDDVDEAEEEVQKAKFSAEAKRVAEEHVKPLRDQLERKEVEARVATVLPAIEKDEISLLKTVFEAVLPEGTDLKMDKESLRKTAEDFEMEAEIANEVATPAADLIGTYQLIANRIVPYNPKEPIHATLVESLERLERFIQSRPADERIRDGKRFVPLEKFVAMKPEEQQGFWAINHDEVVAWIAEEARQTAVKKWEKRKSQLDKYSSRNGGTVSVSVRKPTPQPEENGSSNPFSSSVVGPGGGDSGRGHVGYGEQVRSNPAQHGIGALMRSIGMVKVPK